MEMIEEAAEALRGGKIIVFPTDTVFGIGCDPFNEEAVAELYALKKRPEEKSIPVLVDSIETAQELGEISEECLKILKKYWPGALTVVVNKKAKFAENLTNSNTIALRMPNHEDLLELIHEAGGALATTSANVSGKPPTLSYDEAYALFAESAAMVLPGVITEGVASTVVDCTTDDFAVLREGPVRIE